MQSIVNQSPCIINWGILVIRLQGQIKAGQRVLQSALSQFFQQASIMVQHAHIIRLNAQGQFVVHFGLNCIL